jgi:hypothetical protein
MKQYDRKKKPKATTGIQSSSGCTGYAAKATGSLSLCSIDGLTLYQQNLLGQLLKNIRSRCGIISWTLATDETGSCAGYYVRGQTGGSFTGNGLATGTALPTSEGLDSLDLGQFLALLLTELEGRPRTAKGSLLSGTQKKSKKKKQAKKELERPSLPGISTVVMPHNDALNGKP